MRQGKVRQRSGKGVLAEWPWAESLIVDANDIDGRELAAVISYMYRFPPLSRRRRCAVALRTVAASDSSAAPPQGCRCAARRGERRADAGGVRSERALGIWGCVDAAVRAAAGRAAVARPRLFTQCISARPIARLPQLTTNNINHV